MNSKFALISLSTANILEEAPVVFMGTNLTLHCMINLTAVEGFTAQDVIWYRHFNSDVEDHHVHGVLNESVATLQIVNAQFGDKGSYFCAFPGEGYLDYFKSASVSVHVGSEFVSRFTLVDIGTWWTMVQWCNSIKIQNWPLKIALQVVDPHYVRPSFTISQLRGIFPGPATKNLSGYWMVFQLAGLQWLTVLSILIRGITITLTGDWLSGRLATLSSSIMLRNSLLTEGKLWHTSALGMWWLTQIMFQLLIVT